MKHSFLALVAAVALAFALALPAAAPAAPATPKPQPKAAKPSPAPAPERHPEIRAAIDSLEHAKEHLQHADHDFGGHRVDAIAAIDSALNQLRICMKYD